MMAFDGPSHQSLLLLPSFPSDLSMNSLRVAYGPALTQAFQHLAQISAHHDTEESETILTIAVAYNGHSRPGYTQTQKMYALMYRLTCNLTMQMSIDVQFGNDIDIRVVFFHSTENNQTGIGARKPDVWFNSLADIANSQRPWSQVFSIESETGEELLLEFSCSRKLSTSAVRYDSPIIRVPGGLTMRVAHDRPLHRPQEPGDSWTMHRSVAVGGTFDHLHAGHKLLLTMTALVLEPTMESYTSRERHLTVGITGDDLLKTKKYRHELETWEQRQGSVQRFLLDFLLYLSAKNALKKSDFVEDSQSHGREVHNELLSGLHIQYKEIFDPFGPTVTDPEITALVVSAETRAGGTAVNDKRTKKEWHALEVFEVDVLDTNEAGEEQSQSDFNSKISSTEIRARIHQKGEQANTTLKGD